MARNAYIDQVVFGRGPQVGLADEVGATGAQTGKRFYDSEGGFRSGVRGNNVALPSPTTVALFDDFLGDVLADEWNPVEGTDTDATQAVLAGGIGGTLRLTSGNDDANGTQATDASGVTSFLNWQASNGGLAMEARVKLSRITLAYMFVGFTDVISAELPIISAGSADTLTSNASDAVGFMFDTNMTADTLWLVGVKNDVDAVAQNTAVAPVADDYITLRVEIDADGRALFFINGRVVGDVMAAAITAAADLTPCVYVSNADGTSVVTLDIDYIHVAMIRALNGDAT